jgi:hypothetical protein
MVRGLDITVRVVAFSILEQVSGPHVLKIPRKGMTSGMFQLS